MRGAERYELRRMIARGGSAEIFEAVEHLDGGGCRAVAVKRLLAAAADEPRARGFRDEGRILARLEHPSIVRIFATGEADGLPFQVLELVEGGDLEHLASSAITVPAEVALVITREIARGLAFIHAQQPPIVHRDVSPENILISWAGEVKLADFGVAFTAEREERTDFGIAKGKLDYMSPEQLRGHAATPQSDVFALGCVLHRMLAGVSPIVDPSVRGDLVSGVEPVLASDLPADVEALVAAALRVDPAERTPSAEALAAACEAALERRGVSRTRERAAIEAWLDEIDTAMDHKAAARGARELVDLELVLERNQQGPPRFVSRVVEARTEPESISGLEPGGRLGPYLVHAVLGRGSTASVYRATRDGEAGELALKVMHTRFSRIARLRRRFLREAQLLASIEDPHVIRVHDAGDVGGALFLATDLLEGRTLSRVIADEGPLSPERTARIAAQIARGLERVHRLGIVHRDLKPANVMIEPGDRVRILDFGIAKLTVPSEDTALTRGGLLGTPGFMAPEQIADPASVGPAADVYALGCVIFHMRSKRVPFTLGPESELVAAMMRPPELAPGDPLAGIAAALLQPVPANRPASAEVVARRLEELTEATAVVRVRTGRTDPPEGTVPTELVTVPAAQPELPDTAPAHPRPLPAAGRYGAYGAYGFAGVIAAVLALVVLITTEVLDRAPVHRGAPIAVAPAPQRREVRPSVVQRAAPAEPEAAAELVLEDPPAPPAREPSRPRPAPARAPGTAPEVEVTRKLAARALVSADLEASDEGRAWLERWQAARDDAAARAALAAELDAVLTRFRIDEAVVKNRLERVSRAIRAARTRLTRAQLDALEKRYFALRLELEAGPAGLEAAASLERELRAALGEGAE